MADLQIFDRREVAGKDFKIYGDIDNPLFLAKDVAEWIEHSNPTEMVRTVDESEKLNSTILSAGQNREVTFLTEDGLYEVLMQSRKPIAKQFKAQVKLILKEIRKTGSYSAKPISPTEALLQSVQILAQQEREIQQIKLQATQAIQQLSVLGERVSNLDSVDLIGDLQQRLNAMIRKYARDNGVAYNVAWSEFTKAYNTAYRANLTALKTNYEERHGRSVTRPQFLAAVGKLEDALRVADKMLNKAG